MKKPIPFGKYYLLDRIAVGGMAEIFKAKVIREEGFERYFAIKRILPSIAEDEEFIKMFIDEAKIAVQLTHANIVPIIDLGKVGDAYFIAMEYVHGKDLRTSTEKLSKKGDSLPVPACCYIIMKACEGLDYAHNKKDAAGRDLNLVHRDVSPQNILISFDGEVKLIDFGIAKAANKAAKTQAGILKGKFGYMSPEQVRGLPLDRRSDIFSTGIVLYEALTGERLFIGESDFSILEKVKNVEIIPPSTYNKSIPEDLERIILKALAREVQDRYQSAIELHDDLQSFMYTYGSFFSRKDMASLMRQIFPEDYEADMKEMESARISVPPGQRRSSAPPPPRKVSAPPPPPPRMTRPSLSGGGLGAAPPPPPTRGKTSIPPPPPPKKTMAGMPAPMPPRTPPPPASFSSPPLQPPREPAASISPMQPAASKPATVPPAKPASMPSPPPAAQMPPPAEPRFTFPSTEMMPAEKRSEGISMEWEDDEMETQIYDKLPEDKVKPVISLPEGPSPVYERVPPPAPSIISTPPPKPKGVSIGVVLGIMGGAVGVAALILIVLLLVARKKEATLIVVPEPKDATVKLDGDKLDSEFPPTLAGIKPGKHTLIVMADNHETKVIELNLSEGQNTQVVSLVRMQASGTGFSLETEPPGATIVIDSRSYPDKTPVRVIDLEEGTHTIRVEKDNYLPYTTEVDLKAGEIITIPKVVLSAKSITASITSVPDDAKVYLVRDGQKKYVGKTPYSGELDPSSSYSVEIQKSGYDTWTGDIKFQPGRDSISMLAQLASQGGVSTPPDRPGTEDEGEGEGEKESGKKSGKKKKKTGGGGTPVVKTGGGNGLPERFHAALDHRLHRRPEDQEHPPDQVSALRGSAQGQADQHAVQHQPILYRNHRCGAGHENHQEPRSIMIELRKDPVTGRWVIISTERALRPIDLKVNDHILEEGPCPFCHGNESMAPNEILAFRPDGSKRDDAGWTLRVVPNRFPALRIEGELKKEGEGMYDKMSGVGAHEVIIETPHHERGLADLPVKSTEDLLWAFRDRLLDLERDTRLKYVMIFKNSGARAGATLEHPHCQLIALPVVPREVNDEMTGAQNYFNFKERCVFCDMLRQEMSGGARLVMRSAMHAAVAPFAARFPFETWVLPVRHASRFEQSDTEEMRSAAEVLHGVLKRISALLGNPPYNFYLHNSPLRTANLPHYHWHIEVLPSVTTVAGFERGSAFYVNPVPPEDSASEMRKAGGMA